VAVDVSFTANQAMEETLDSANFTNKLDQLILGFRTETMQEFIKTKGRLNSQKEQAIDAERRRCNTLLNAKQNEIEQLKEQLAQKSKMSDEYSLRCEIMALWSGKGQTLARMRVS
jgi:ATP-dependent Zn protease